MISQRLRDVIRIARVAGDTIGAQKERLKRAMLKVDGSPVTEADTVSQDIILSALAETGIPVLSEESPTEGILASDMWLVDPLDGTEDFLGDTGDFSVMIGLLNAGVPALGVIYAPMLGVLYAAEKDMGAYAISTDEERRIRVSNTQDASALRMVASRFHYSPLVGTVSGMLGTTVPERRGSIGIKSGLIAEGKAEFQLSQGKLGLWDVCASECILVEAGGRVTDLDGSPLSYRDTSLSIENGFIASNGYCHDLVRRTCLRACGKESSRY